jgi:hypothetical protein
MKITCVDQWRPYFDEDWNWEPHYQAMNEAAQDDKIFKLLHNIHATNVAYMVDYRVGDAREFCPTSPTPSSTSFISTALTMSASARDVRDASLYRTVGLFAVMVELQRIDVDNGSIGRRLI